MPCRFSLLKRSVLCSRLGSRVNNCRQYVHAIAEDLTGLKKAKLNQEGSSGSGAVDKNEMSSNLYLWIWLDLGEKGRRGCSTRTAFSSGVTDCARHARACFVLSSNTAASKLT